MQSTVARSKEFWSGLLFLAIGCGAAAMALNYPIGTVSRMGPGFFPLVLGGTLALLGIIFIAQATLSGRTPLSATKPIAIICVLGSAAVFAGLLEGLGLAIAAFLLIVVAYAGGADFRARRAIPLAVALATFVVILFAMLLKLQVPIGPMLWN